MLCIMRKNNGSDHLCNTFTVQYLQEVNEAEFLMGIERLIGDHMMQRY